MAVFGSILIALGVVWLMAQNWHQMPAAAKIIVLLTATGASYTAGTVFRVRDYAGIGKSLLVLGALLYTLSIFLIAQIFFTSTALQGQAWLWLLALCGVIAAAYIFESMASYVIAIIEYFIWVFVQTSAFFENISLFSSVDFGYIVLIPFFTVTGIAVAINGVAVLYIKRRESKS